MMYTQVKLYKAFEQETTLTKQMISAVSILIYTSDYPLFGGSRPKQTPMNLHWNMEKM